MKEKREKWTKAEAATGSSKIQKTSLDLTAFLGFRAKENLQACCDGKPKKKKKKL